MNDYNFITYDDIYIITSHDFTINSKTKFALFDLNGTLITPKNGYDTYYFWRESNPKMYTYLGEERIFSLFKELKKNDYVVCIITNQYNFNKSVKRRLKFIHREMVEKLGWSPIIMATIYPPFLKPDASSFELLLSMLNIDSKTFNKQYLNSTTYIKNFGNVPNLFYCGDSAGFDHPDPAYRLSEHDIEYAKSISELLQVKNICKFLTPADLWGHHTVLPRKYQELIVMMGLPGSGKSKVSYELISQSDKYLNCETDVLSWDRKKVIKCCDESLKNGYSVIINALNPSRQKRGEFIRLAKKYNIPVRILWFIRDGRPYNNVRGSEESMYTTTYEHLKPVPKKVYDKYIEEFEEPKMKEFDIGEIEIVY